MFRLVGKGGPLALGAKGGKTEKSENSSDGDWKATALAVVVVGAMVARAFRPKVA